MVASEHGPRKSANGCHRLKPDQRDRYNLSLVRCWNDDLDLGQEMVRLGWAKSEYGTEYHREQELAQAAKSGAWAGTFEGPWEWRKSYPQ